MNIFITTVTTISGFIRDKAKIIIW